MEKFKALYKAMYDDLKDSEMMIEYAYKIKEKDEKDGALAKEIASYAAYRLAHFMEFHKLFVAESAKYASKVSADAVDHCMWGETHKMMQEWYESIKHKIDHYA
jgi:hypothetical protein